MQSSRSGGGVVGVVGVGGGGERIEGRRESGI